MKIKKNRTPKSLSLAIWQAAEYRGLNLVYFEGEKF